MWHNINCVDLQEERIPIELQQMSKYHELEIGGEKMFEIFNGGGKHSKKLADIRNNLPRKYWYKIAKRLETSITSSSLNDGPPSYVRPL